MGETCSTCANSNQKELQEVSNMQRAEEKKSENDKITKKPEKNTHKTMELAMQQLLNWKQSWGDGVCAMIVFQNNTEMYLNLESFNFTMEGKPYEECRTFSHHIAPKKFWSFLHIKTSYAPQGCTGWLCWNINKNKHNKNKYDEFAYGAYFVTIGWSVSWPFGTGNGLNIVVNDRSHIFDSDDMHDTNVLSHNDNETGFTVQASCLSISSSIYMYKISHAHDVSKNVIQP